VLCVEVLEHVPNPSALLSEIARVLRKDGSLVMTVPWSARLHHVPHDYRRYTRYGLCALLEASGFVRTRVEERGNDIAVMANKLLVVNIRLLRPKRWWEVVWSWPLAAIVAPVTAGFLVAAHLAIRFHLGSGEDPLGYGVVAVKL
jgi:SAM-dependent methyltransferase